MLECKNVTWIIIIIIIYELIVHSLTWEWSAAHYNCITLQETNTEKIMHYEIKNEKNIYACK